MRSQSHERSWPPLFKLKFGNGWLISKCCGSHCKKSIPVFNSNSNSNSRVFNSNSIFNSTNFNSNSNSNSGIGIGIDQQFQFRNWIDPNPVTEALIKLTNILQACSNALSWMKMKKFILKFQLNVCFYIQIYWILLPRAELTASQCWFR